MMWYVWYINTHSFIHSKKLILIIYLIDQVQGLTGRKYQPEVLTDRQMGLMFFQYSTKWAWSLRDLLQHWKCSEKCHFHVLRICQKLQVCNSGSEPNRPTHQCSLEEKKSWKKKKGDLSSTSFPGSLILPPGANEVDLSCESLVSENFFKSAN